ncbi:hypothetical protein Nepgr_003239 [Nepenthes gracilis]|uniref:Uncharacterized protein n=1 Tax=Nepenthes gracilis TaxID=150966 RepID=A0AAD3RZ44_NEPGR|nr:hypothetical protein Nepgr_003239 [Nepenthes gracilis]
MIIVCSQAAQDGVDIISLSITPNRRPPGIATYFNPIDLALLTAVKAGIFVVQAAGNTGPSPRSISSFSPWIFTVGAAAHDRLYSNSITLGNNVTITGVGLALLITLDLHLQFGLGIVMPDHGVIRLCVIDSMTVEIDSVHAGTNKGALYTMISASDALNNNTMAMNDMYSGECQDAGILSRDVVEGNLLICSYSVRFILGVSTVKQALRTAKNLSAAGIIFYVDPFMIGFQLNPTPMDMPSIVIPSVEDSKILLQFYNASLERDGVTKKIIKFGAVASISGGLKANYNNSAPKIMYYSARGPDPEDSSLDDADILKPNLVAPGNFIWAAWSSLGSDSVEFQGENFAMMSGTSMAAPHVAGLAALVKQKFPSFSTSAIGSALSTTASLHDKNGGPVMAQHAYGYPDTYQSPATSFDMGSGFVNATAALDPGLIFDSSYEDYVLFLCGINGSAAVVLNYTGLNCGVSSTMNGADLNFPSITIAKLKQTRVVRRTVTNVATVNETYSIGWSAPYGVALKVTPMHFSIATGERQVLKITFHASVNNTTASFGRIVLFGNQGHTANIPVSVNVKISCNAAN